MGKKAAIVQSNYIPWKGYFDLINRVDEFILYDDMQYTKRDWRNRNRIKTPDGLLWLTIPVTVKDRFYQKIKDTVVSDREWNKKHWKTIAANYSKSRHFNDYCDIFEELYLKSDERFLSEINFKFISALCSLLGITTVISHSMDYHLCEGKTERLVDLCMQAGAEEYISGPAANDYINEELFRREGITLSYMDYSGYPEYNQLYGQFEHSVSIIDLIFNEGADAPRYMKSF